MPNERENLVLSHAELAGGEFLESESLAEERLPERQYCVFRGRSRALLFFCSGSGGSGGLADRDPSAAGARVSDGCLQLARNNRSAGGHCVHRRPTSRSTAETRGGCSIEERHAARDLRLGIAADEVIGTYSATEESMLDQAPAEVPHCRGMLRHDDRLALVVDLRRLTDVFPVPVI